MPDLKLLSTANDKLIKGMADNYITLGLSLSPNTTSGYDLCKMATLGCIASCLFVSGYAKTFKSVNEGRRRKAKLFIEERATFWKQLISDLIIAKRGIENRAKDMCVRLNVVADIEWEQLIVWYQGRRYANIFELFPTVQFYDYTKIPGRVTPNNYHLTFSRSENNISDCIRELDRGKNVAVVFDRNIKFPTSFFNREVIVGDNNDLRFLDPPGVIVGLKSKNKATADTTGFRVA